jgi:haloalkane dehalogenase
MIGFGWALQHAASIKRLVITNTASFTLPAGKKMPWQLTLGRDSSLGALLIRGFNAFAAGAASQGVCQKMPSDVRDAYCAPYDSWANRIATLRFVQDIPLKPSDAAWPMVEAAGQALPDFADRPAFIGWGLKDFVFDSHFLERFRQDLPQAEVHAFEDAGHYVMEDKSAVLVPKIADFLQRNPLR